MNLASRSIVLTLCAVALLLSRGAAGASLEAPEGAGMRHVGNNVYVDPKMSGDKANALLRLVDLAQKRVGIFYGELRARPKIVFCATSDCYREFGAVGLGYTDGSNLVISPNGQRVAILAHELAHVEFSARVGGFAKVMKQVPQWFDEGQAVMVSMAEEFSDDAWRKATDGGKNAPQLYSLVSMADWVRQTGAEGEHMQLTYGTAKQEVSRWFSRSGPSGFQALLTALSNNESFAAAYSRVESAHGQLADATRAERSSSVDLIAAPVPASPEGFSRSAW